MAVAASHHPPLFKPVKQVAATIAAHVRCERRRLVSPDHRLVAVQRGLGASAEVGKPSTESAHRAGGESVA